MTAVNQGTSPPKFEQWMAEHRDFVAKHIVRENENDIGPARRRRRPERHSSD